MVRWMICLACLALTSPARAQWVYTALGASDALGVGASPSTNGYVYLIANWMDARYSPWQLSNRGASGYTAPQIVANTLTPAINDNPRIVTLWIGGNDIKNSVIAGESTPALAARYREAYTTIIRRLRLETNAFIVTANLPDLSRVPAAVLFSQQQRDLGRADTEALNAIIAEVASAYQVPVVDLYSDPESYVTANYSWDGFHPSNAGYAKIAARFETVLREQAWRLVSGLGDMDGNGNVQVPDVEMALRINAGMLAGTDRQATAGDVWPRGGDGRMDMQDITGMLRRVHHLVPDTDWR